MSSQISSKYQKSQKILLGIIAVVGDNDGMVVTHGLDDVFLKVSARRHIFQKDSFLELAAVADHSIEREGIEHPTSGTSFLEAVAILYVIKLDAATADKMALFFIRKADKNIIKRMIDRCLDDFFKKTW